MYSVTSRSSFDEARSIHEQVLRVKDSDDVPAILIGNKIDLERERYSYFHFFPALYDELIMM